MKTPANIFDRLNNYLDEPRPIDIEWDQGDEWDDDEDEDGAWDDDDEGEEYTGETAGEFLLALGGGCLLVLVLIIVFPLMVVAQCVKLNKN